MAGHSSGSWDGWPSSKGAASAKKHEFDGFHGRCAEGKLGIGARFVLAVFEGSGAWGYGGLEKPVCVCSCAVYCSGGGERIYAGV